MKVVTTKKELIEILNDFQDTDAVVIEVHDMVANEDLYRFYVDPIHMGVDENNKDRGNEIRLSILPNAKSWYEAYTEIDGSTETIKTFDSAPQMLEWYGKLEEEFKIGDVTLLKSKVSVDLWGEIEGEQAQKSHTIF